jgi:hypothetical protein
MTAQYPDEVKRNKAEDLHTRRAAGRWRRRVMRGEYGPLFAFRDVPGSIATVGAKMKRGDVLIVTYRHMVQP